MTARFSIVFVLAIVAAGAVWWTLRDADPQPSTPADSTTDPGGDAARGPTGSGGAAGAGTDDPGSTAAGGATTPTPTRTDESPTTSGDGGALGSARVTGRVVDEDGRPIAGATVELLRVAGGLFAVQEAIGATTRTTGAGGYAFESTPTDTALAVRATAPGYAEVRVDAPAPRAGISIAVPDLVLARGIVVSGRITDADRGTPVPGADVTLRLVRGGVLADPLGGGLKARSDSSGLYRAEGLRPETYRFTVVANGYVDAQVDRSFFAARTRKDVAFDLALQPSSGTIAGAAVDANGAPIADASITATAERPNTTPHVVVTRSRADGTFDLARLGPWMYQVEAIAPRHDLPQPVDVRATDGTLTLVLARKATIAGNVVFEDGAGIARVDASVAPADGTSPKLFAQTPAAADGAFVIENVPSGSIVLDVASDVAAPTRFGPFDVAPGAQLTGVELRVTRGPVARGRVALPDGSPAAHANVVLVPADFDVARVDAALILLEGTLRKNARCDASGAFTLQGLPDGAFRVRAEAPGFSAAWSASFSTGEQPDTNLGVLRLASACAIDGVVVDSNGNPVAQAVVRARTKDGLAGGITATDGLGRFRFGTLAPGDWVVTAVKPHPQFGALDETAEATIAASGDAAASVRLTLARKGP